MKATTLNKITYSIYLAGIVGFGYVLYVTSDFFEALAPPLFSMLVAGIVLFIASWKGSK